MPYPPPQGIAIIGSGIFVREEHVPAVLKADNEALKAIYSRSLQSAKNLLDGIVHPREPYRKFDPDFVDLYSEDPGDGRGYADLLKREDIGAVIIALPITVQPDYIRRAILAGKHVLSEKPIAKDLATALELLRWYRANTGPDHKVLWGVGENIRYQDKFSQGRWWMRDLGPLKDFRVSVHSLIGEDSKYYKTEWRKNPEYQGGFVLDGGIHIIAALRWFLTYSFDNDAIATVSAESSLQQPHLAPVDTVNARFTTTSGATGTLSLSYGSFETKDQVFEFHNGGGETVILDGDQAGIKRPNGGNDVRSIRFSGRGVDNEIRQFSSATRHKWGMVDRKLSPEEALGDLEVMEKILKSAEQNGEEMKLDYQIWFPPEARC